MPDGKTLQIGTVHNLGQTFAKTFDITYETATGEHEYVYQTCYGLSDRIIASVIGIHGDKSGLCMPPAIAPYQVVIVPIIFKKGAEEVLDFCRNLEDKLRREANLRVYFDDRDIRAGKKYYEWEMRGIPLRIEVGPRDLENKKVVTFRRDSQEKEIIDYNPDAISENVNEILDDISLNMKDKAWGSFENSIRSVDSIDEAAEERASQGICGLPLCSDKVEKQQSRISGGEIYSGELVGRFCSTKCYKTFLKCRESISIIPFHHRLIEEEMAKSDAILIREVKPPALRKNQ
jgi:prolyl-tRNA synthetase